MIDLLDIQEKLQDTAAVLAKLRAEIPTRPDSVALSLEIKSLEKRMARLESLMLDAAAQNGLDVCSYRIIPGQRLRLAGLTTVLGDYQSLISVFYDALKRGARTKAVVAPESAEATALEFAYAFAGSAGFVFSVPNDRDLFNDSDFDESLRLIDEASKAKSPEEILAFARRLGPAPIRVLYRWAFDHVKSSFSADIEWRHGQQVRQKTLVQVPEFDRLQKAITLTSEEEQEKIVLPGELVGADVSNRTFHFRPDRGSDVRGSSGTVIDQTHSVELPKRYTATILKTTTILFSTEEEQVAYELVRLREI